MANATSQLLDTTATQHGWDLNTTLDGDREYTKGDRFVIASFDEAGSLTSATISRPRGNGRPSRIQSTSFAYKVIDELARDGA